MDLIDVKRTEADKKAERDKWDKPATSSMEDYPYGLTLHLDNETIGKLGLSDADFDAGQPVAVIASGMIVSESLNSVGGKKMRSMSIQLQKMSVHQEAQKVSAVDALYGDKK
jgi:hypothetical protein